MGRRDALTDTRRSDRDDHAERTDEASHPSTTADDDATQARFEASHDMTMQALGARGTNAKQAQNTHEETPESPENYAMRV